MGCWGPLPWDNDKAAEWLLNFDRGLGLSHALNHYLENVQVDDSNHEEIRAAISLVLVLSPTGLFEPDLMEKLSRLSQSHLKEIAKLEVLKGEDFQKQINLEIHFFDAMLSGINNDQSRKAWLSMSGS